MGFISNAILGFCAGICVIVGLNLFQKKRSKARIRRAIDLASLARANAEDYRKLFPKELFPSWIQFPEFERVNWLNKELKDIWKFVNLAASNVLRDSLEPVLEQYRPAVLASLRFQKLTLGTIAPQFGGIKFVDSPPNEIVLEMDFKWGGNPSIVLDVQTFLGLSLPVHVKDVSFFGVFRIAFTPLVDTLPCFGAVTVALSEKPTLNFSLNIVGGEVTSIPGLSSALDGLIRTAVNDSLLWPMRHVIPIVPGDYKYLELHPVGQLDVKLVEGRDLINLDLMMGKSDPFAIVYVRPIPTRMKKSRTKRGTLNPVWNEVMTLIVEDLSSQRIHVNVMHEGELLQSRPLGEASLELTGLEPGVITDVWLPLVKDMDNPKADPKDRGKIHLEIIYRPMGEDGQPSDSVPSAFGMSTLEKELGLGASAPLVPITPRQKEKFQRGVLMVTVERGVDLVQNTMKGYRDPYVVLYMQLTATKKRTKVINKSLNPAWNETFDFLVEDAAHDMLNLEVWDHDIFGKQSMGKAAVTLTRVMYDADYRDEVQLRDVSQGSICISLKWKVLS